MLRVAVIGSGFAGLSAASYLSYKGCEVHVFEKNTTPGGRARQLKTTDGYIFDMGPSWYWMPDVYENFFSDFNYSASDFYQLKQLTPAFNVVFDNRTISVPNDTELLGELFESIEKGSAKKLNAFMYEAKFKYEMAMEHMIEMPGLSLKEFADIDVIKNCFRLNLFSSLSKHVKKHFSNPKLIALMEFPVLFLGAMPQQTPALYSLMNYAGLALGTWYPVGGFGKVVEAIVKVASENSAKFYFNCAVEKITINDNSATGLVVNGEELFFDAIVAAADYEYVERELLPEGKSNYSENYWRKKTFAPSCLIYYLGLNKKIKSIEHHTLFFDEDLNEHSKEIYQNKQWPAKPLFYVCCPSKSDDFVAPSGHENLFLLMPIAPGLEDNETTREKYFDIMMNRLEHEVGEELATHIDFKKSYCINDFIEDYHSYKGNAYGLANTLMQTAVLKPKIRNKKIKNLFYAGQLTVPGPGVPPALLSGKIVSQQVLKYLN